MKKLCFVATIPDVLHSFMKVHIRTAAEKWQVAIITNPQRAELLQDLNAQFIPLDIRRKVSPWCDLIALIRLTQLFRSERFNLVHSIMPKTGLLVMLAGMLAGVPVRIHTFTGQVWANKRGWKRSAFRIVDRLIVAFATRILVDSPSQRDFLVSEGVLKPGHGIVIGVGSICGVDSRQFHPDVQVRDLIRNNLNIGKEQIVILFLGRLNRDKGILDLAEAFTKIAAVRPNVVLMLVGAEEDVPFARIQEICGRYRDRLRRVNFTADPQHYMATADILCLPSYREGFGQVVIEAAACGVPTVASRIYGVTDAVEDNKTGLLFTMGDIPLLTNSLLALIDDEVLRDNLGEAARLRALNFFDSEKISFQLVDLYEKTMT